LNWLFSGKFITYPNLKIALAEGNIGWIPYFLERAEYVIERQRYWTNRGEKFDGQGGVHNNIYIDWDTYDIRAAYHDHIFGCFLDDKAGLALLDVVGEDNVMVEVDYPHGDTTWPHSLKLMKERLVDLTPEQQYKILRGNAERLFNFTPVEPSL
jgi:predicted TIM-barrel fold metal-dependent hydrolase